MDKTIKVTGKTYQKIKAIAKREKRNIKNTVELMLEKYEKD